MATTTTKFKLVKFDSTDLVSRDSLNTNTDIIEAEFIVLDEAKSAVETNVTALQTAVSGKEAALGNPTVDGMVLASTVAGVRNWVAQSSGSGSGVTVHNELTGRDTAEAHPISAITDLATTLAAKIDSAEKGAASGICPLGADSLIASTYLPSYVDDVVEYASSSALPTTGESGKIYVTTDTTPPKQWRWSGTAYISYDSSPGTTDSLTEGTANLYFTVARVLATVLTGFSSSVTAAAVTAANTVLEAFQLLQAQCTSLAGSISTLTAGLAAVYTKTESDSTFLALTKYNTEKTMVFFGTGQTLRYPWAGSITQIQVNCSTTRTAAITFYVEKQSNADYIAQSATWTRIGGDSATYSLAIADNYSVNVPAGSVAVAAGDVFKITIDTAVENFAVQVLVKNTVAE